MYIVSLNKIIFVKASSIELDLEHAFYEQFSDIRQQVQVLEFSSWSTPKSMEIAELKINQIAGAAY